MKNPWAVIIDDIEFARCQKEVYAKALAHLWTHHSGEGGVVKVVDLRAKRCDECGQVSDARLCEGCHAYAAHTAV